MSPVELDDNLMFTGLIEEVGAIRRVEAGPEGARITVAAQAVLEGARIGDSIAVDGACMTIVALDGETFAFEASPESLSKTNFNTFKPGSRVNLERPLTPQSRIGGHYVTGHVDGPATVVSVAEEGNSRIVTFEAADPALAGLLVPKGSVAVLGISLTVNTVSGNRFTVAIIPHTLAHTNLGDYGPGSRVNIETDLLGKYVRRLMAGQKAEAPDVGVMSAIRDADDDEPLSSHEGALLCGARIDDAALVPALDAVALTHAPSPAKIRTGGWFNYDAD